jgi:hypothetical protein
VLRLIQAAMWPGVIDLGKSSRLDAPRTHDYRIPAGDLNEYCEDRRVFSQENHSRMTPAASEPGRSLSRQGGIPR